MNEGQWSGLELKSVTVLVSLGHLYRDGNRAQTGILSSAGKEASHEWIGISVLVVGRGRGEDRKRECAWARQPRPSPGSIFPWGSILEPLESSVRWGAFCAKERSRPLPAQEGLTAGPLGLLFPSLRRLHRSGCANTDVDTMKQNEPVHATVLTCLLNLRDMRSDQRALRLEVKKQIIKYLDSDLSFCPDLA